MRRYYAKPVTQDDVNAAAREIASKLEGRNLTVRPNGNGHRIECQVSGCGWSKSHGTVQGAIAHAGSHN